jgi:hypothetical protein
MPLWSVASNAVDLKSNFTGFGDLVNRSTPLLQTFQAYGRINQASGFPILWNVYTAAATSADVQEGVDISTFSYQAEVQASLPVVAKYVPIRLGAVMKANAEAGGTYEMAMENQTLKSSQDALKALETAFCGATQDVGLQAINDSTGTYAGINQVTVTSWAGVELSTVGGSIHGQATSLLASLQSRGVGVSTLCAFGHPTAIRKFSLSAHASGSVHIVSPPGGGPIDAGLFPHQYRWNGIPFVAVDSLPAGDIHFLDMSDASIEMLKGPVIESIDGSSLDSKLAVVVMGGLKLATRNRHGKLTGCDNNTAT